MEWAPVNEEGKGKGRNYENPVKVLPQSDGSVQITEWDGDQFVVKPNGTFTILAKPAGGKMGTSLHMAGASEAYTKAQGTEQTYYGRGYMQLTWWEHYATAGISLGRGLDLLLNPDLALIQRYPTE